MKNTQVKIFDTTLRDGEQAPGCQLNPSEKLEIAKQLSRLGVDVIEAGFPISSPADFEAVKAIARKVGNKVGAPEICGLARSVEADIRACWDAVQYARRPRIHTFFATSDIHLKHKFKISRVEAMKRIIQGIKFATSFTSNVQFSPEDASRSNRAFLVKVIEAAIDAGAKTINIPDTVGYAMPSEFGELIRFVIRSVPNIDKATVSVHCHDDLGMAVANTLMAVRNGARQIEGAINGIGERAGNCALEEVIMAIKVREQFFNVSTKIKTRELFATSQMLEKKTGMKVSANKAIVGSNAFAHASGIHQDGFLKHQQTYEIMRPEDVGVSQSTLTLTSRSGRRAVADRIQKMGLEFDLSKIDAVFHEFKKVADLKKIVHDHDLVQILSAVNA